MDNIRIINENNEKLFLSPHATLSCNTKGREVFEEECELRTAFQRDRDIHVVQGPIVGIDDI